MCCHVRSASASAARRRKFRAHKSRIMSPRRQVRLLVRLCRAALAHQVPRAGGTL